MEPTSLSLLDRYHSPSFISHCCPSPHILFRRDSGLQSLLNISCSFTPHRQCMCLLCAYIALLSVQHLTSPSLLKLSTRRNFFLQALMNMMHIFILAFIFCQCNCSLHVCLSLRMTPIWAEGLCLLALYILSLRILLCIPSPGWGT